MLKKLTLSAATLAMSAGAMVPLSSASAQDYYGRGYGYDRGYSYDRGYRDNYNRDYYYRDHRYYGRSYYRPHGRGCDNTGGTIVGAVAGGLLGRMVDRHGDRSTGTILGALAGGFAGNRIDASDNPGYCRR